MPIDCLNKVCDDIWNRLKISLQLGINQGEETISDNLILYIAQYHFRDIRVIQTPKNKESVQGTDWEWWIGNNCKGWLRYAIQAKKLYSKENRYKSLKHTVGSAPNQVYQHDILENYSNVNNAIPLYVFYNYIEKDDYNVFWHCCLSIDESKLGCTVTPLRNVKTAISHYGFRTFDTIHQFQETIPLRCLVCCQNISATYRGSPNNIYTSIDELTELRSIESYKQLPQSLYNHDTELYPKRILILETKNNEN